MDTYSLKDIDDLTENDFVIVGIPSDYGSIYEIGNKDAPDMIRKASLQYSGVNYELNINFYDCNVVDYGNIGHYTDLNSFLKEIELLSNKISKTGSYPIYIGGNHLITFPIIKGLEIPKEKIGIIWVDSHLDFMDEYPEGERFTIATSLRRIIEIENIRPDNIAIVGVHGNTQGTEEIEIAKTSIPSIYSMDYIERIGIDRLISILKNQFIDIKYVHISIDLDAIDPAFAPGVSVPEPGGFTSREILKIIRALTPISKSMDIVEYLPVKDHSEITAKLACSLIIDSILYHKVDEKHG
ncbi:MAG: arginase family protein [Candidatus Helarchaeota archaeon]